MKYKFYRLLSTIRNNLLEDFKIYYSYLECVGCPKREFPQIQKSVRFRIGITQLYHGHEDCGKPLEIHYSHEAWRGKFQWR